jgi:hypothetical protein
LPSVDISFRKIKDNFGFSSGNLTFKSKGYFYVKNLINKNKSKLFEGKCGRLAKNQPEI